MRIVESLVYLIQYDKKNLKFLKASVKSVDGEVKKNVDKKKQSFDPMAMKIPFNPMALGSLFMDDKDESTQKKVEQDTDNFNESQELDDT